MRETYDKLVRDGIPAVIEASDERPITRIAEGEEYRERLHEKLDEEVAEFHEDPGVDELADLLDVLDALRRCYDIEESHLEDVRQEKADERGRFADGIVLEAVER